MSGLSRTPGKRVYVNNVSRVRIPSSPPQNIKTVTFEKRTVFIYTLNILMITMYLPNKYSKITYSGSLSTAMPLQNIIL